MMLKRFFYGFLFIFLALQYTYCQNHKFKTFSAIDGFKTYNATATLQDKFGFVWVLTQDGIYRYNGQKFELYSKSTDQDTSSIGSIFMAGYYDSKDNLYLADYSTGLNNLNIETLECKPVPGSHITLATPNLSNYWIQKIFIDSNESIWIANVDYIAVKRKSEKYFRKLPITAIHNSEIKVSSICQPNATCIVVSEENAGTLIFDINSFEVIGSAKEYGKATPFFANDILSSGSTIWALSGNKIFRLLINGRQVQMQSAFTFSESDRIMPTSFVICKNMFWIGTSTGLISYDTVTGNKMIYNRSNGLSDNRINHLRMGKERNLWICTSSALQVLPTSPPVFTAFTGKENGGDAMGHLYEISEKSINEIFSAGTDGLYITDLKLKKTTKVKGSGHLGILSCVCRINEEFWVLASQNGLYGYQQGKGIVPREIFLKRFPEWKDKINNYFNKAFRYGDKIYWASEGNQGLTLWDLHSGKIETFSPGTSNSRGITEGHIRNLKADKEGYLWLLCDNRAFQFDMSRDYVVRDVDFSVMSGKNKINILFDFYDDGKKYWFGTYSFGVVSLDKKDAKWGFINNRNGLCNNCVYSIIPTADSVFWVSTNFGISKINHVTKTCINYFASDGLQDNSFDELSALPLNDKLYFGGLNGFTEINYSLQSVNDTFRVPVYFYKLDYFKEGILTTVNCLNISKIQLPAGTGAVNLYLAALSTTGNDKINFFYRIKEIGNEYYPVLNSNIISLAGINKGQHTIDVKYYDTNGVLHENENVFHIYILPKWYQTWWFYLLIALTVAAILYALYRYRIAQIKKQHEIRKNIATDLHDDLGSTLNSVKVFTNLAISGIKQEESLQQVKDNLTEATMSLRDMIWVLDDSLDTVDELITRLKQFALPVAAASNIEASIKADSDVNSRQLTKEEKRNLFLICKEAINNSIKYSGGSRIDVSITASGKKIQIVVSDNGKGFKVDEVKKGYGLKNMQYRAGQIKYKVALVSSPGNGTQITILPA